MDIQDFTFPRRSDTCNSYDNIDSPPLWNLSPAEGNKDDGKDCFEAKLNAQGQRKSLSCVQNGKKRMGVDDVDQEDPMDLLWEGFFTEDLSSTRGSATSSSREVVESRCSTLPNLTVAKTSGALLSTKSKHGIVVIVKVLRKLFSSLNNSQGKQRKSVL